MAMCVAGVGTELHKKCVQTGGRSATSGLDDHNQISLSMTW
jgi:hypothetical protein